MNRFQYHINCVVAALYNKGLRHAVISPGSRNAPIIMAFARFGKIQCHSAVDERAAAFIALGIAKQSGQSVAVVCTSGSALANFYPAVLEAYYMQVPLLVISADRPAEMIDRWDGQTIHQSNLFGQHIKGSFSTPEHREADLSQWFISAAYDTYDAANGQVAGPAHLNMPLQEPLYEAVKETFEYPELNAVEFATQHEETMPEALKNAVLNNKCMFLFGADHTASNMDSVIEQSNVVVLADLMSNRRHLQSIQNWESVLLQHDNKNALMPEVLISFGKMVLNKTLKQLLRQQKIQHWHIDMSGYCADTFFSEPQTVRLSQETFFKWYNAQAHHLASDYLSQWRNLAKSQLEVDWQLDDFTELVAVAQILKQIPETAVLHVSNSMSVRNAAYMAQYLHPSIKVYCNRGVSGIDGCSSTALGMAMADQKHQHVLLSGDLAFLYDINAYFVQTIPANFKVVVMNNGGGGIFKILEGPDKMPELQPFVFTPQNIQIEALTKAYGLHYLKAENAKELSSELDNLLNTEQAAVLEIRTDADTNAKQFKQFKNHKI